LLVKDGGCRDVMSHPFCHIFMRLAAIEPGDIFTTSARNLKREHLLMKTPAINLSSSGGFVTKNWPRTFSAAIMFCAFAMLFSATSARAAINIMDGPSALQTAAASTLTTTSFTVSSGASVMVAYYGSKDATPGSGTATVPTTLTFNTTPPQTLTLIVTTNSNNGATYGDVAIYYLANPVAGSGTITANQSNGDGLQIWVMAYTLTNVDTTVSPVFGGSFNDVGTAGLKIMSNSVVVAANNSWAAIASIGRNGASGNIVNFSPNGGTLVSSNNNQGAVGCVGFSYVSGLPSGTDIFYATNTVTNPKNAMAEAVFAPLNPPPATPATFTATGSTSPSAVQVSLSWMASAGATTYNIKRGPSSGTYTVTNVVVGGSTISYVDSQVTNGFTYFYTISAANSSGTSADFSPAQSVTPTGVPQTPTGLTAVNNGSAIGLSWTGSFGATSYSVYRGTSSGGESGTALATGLTSASYTDSPVTSGTVYYYKVTATGTGGESAQSSEASTLAGNNTLIETTTGDSVDWNTSTIWTNATVPTGTAISPANNYISSTTNATANYGVNWGLPFISGRVRATDIAGTNTFGGGSLTIVPGCELLLKQGSAGHTASAYIIFTNYGGLSPAFVPMIRLGPNAPATGPVHLAGTISNAVDSYIACDFSAITLSVDSTVIGTNNNITLLTGNNGKAASANSTNLLTGDWSAFAGNLNLANTNAASATGNFEFTNSVATMNSMGLLMARTDAVVILDEAITVQSFSITNNQVLGGTTYTPAQLAGLGFGGTFLGSGTLTVLNSIAKPVDVAIAPGGGQNTLSWQAVVGAVSYNIYRGTSSGSETLLTSGVTASSYADTGLPGLTTYYYYVVAVDSSANLSANSAEVSAQTGPSPTSLSLASSENPSGFNDSVNFTANVLTNGTLLGNATGMIQFFTNNILFDTESVSSGGATSVSITLLPRGTNLITAFYSGFGSYAGSTNSFNQIVTNHPPTATVMTVNATAGENLGIALSDLATNWTDADGDTVELTAINFTTTNGVTLTLINTTTNNDGSYVITNNAFIGYTNSLNVNDQFSYTISDGFGGTNTGIVNIIANPFVSGTQITAPINGGSASLNFFGIPGYNYVTQRATNLAPAIIWVNISTNTAAPNGAFNVIDNFSDLGGTPASAFYRLIWTP
jgi:fibronectin type 3 domain-containing protein